MDSEEEEDDERFYSAEEGGNHVIEEEEEHEVQIDVEDIPDEEEEDEEPGDDVPEIVDVMRLFLDHEEDHVIEISNDEDEVSEDEERQADDSEMQEEEEERSTGTNRTTFDTGLPTTHSYLGDDLDVLQGRTIHPDGETVSLPLFHVPNVVIVPGQILPLNLFHPQAIAMMRRVISADKTFGFIIPSDRPNKFADVGVTCEIYSVKEEAEYGVSQMMLKAEGRQRFKVLDIQPQLDGVLMGKIRILPDAYISPQPRGSLICCQQYEPNALRSQMVSNHFHLANDKWSSSAQRYLAGFNPKKAHLLCTSLTSTQGWIYRLYNPYFLMDCLLNEIRSWNQNLQFDTIPRDPVEFSHWITANLPFTNEMKIQFLEVDSAPLRMRKQIDYMKQSASTLACSNCDATITDKNELFSLSKRGPMGAYVNPNGYVHETVTFYKAKNLSLYGRKSKQFSWFPGYAWTIAHCKDCGRHMGWKFTATENKLKPSKFWGLTRAALKPVFKSNLESFKTLSTNCLHDGDLNPIQYESNI